VVASAPRNRQHVAAIDGLRAIAVLAVLALHAAGAPSPGAPAWTRCGERGVDLFFVISGFCLSYPYVVSVREGRALDISYGRFMARRLARIGPPYFAALGLFALLSLTAFGLPTASTHPDAAHLLRELGFDSVFLTNSAPTIDAAFWTLGVEMRWYLLFPILLHTYVRSRLGFIAVGAACYVAYFFTPWSFADLGMLPCFMLGIVAADLHIERSPLVRIAPAVAAFALAVGIWQQAHSWSIDHGNPLWHLAVFSIVVSSEAALVSRVLRFKPLALVGVASYSIYLVHQPIVKSLEFAHLSPALSAVSALTCGIAFYVLVERPSLRPAFRSRVELVLARLAEFVRRPVRRYVRATDS